MNHKVQGGRIITSTGFLIHSTRWHCLAGLTDGNAGIHNKARHHPLSVIIGSGVTLTGEHPSDFHFTDFINKMQIPQAQIIVSIVA